MAYVAAKTPAAGAKADEVFKCATDECARAMKFAFSESFSSCETHVQAARLLAAKKLEEIRHERAAAGASGASVDSDAEPTAGKLAESSSLPQTTTATRTTMERSTSSAPAAAAAGVEESASTRRASSGRVVLLQRLVTFAKDNCITIRNETFSWVKSEFSGDWAAVAAAAEGGDAKAHVAMSHPASGSLCDAKTAAGWMCRAMDQGHRDAHISVVCLTLTRHELEFKNEVHKGSETRSFIMKHMDAGMEDRAPAQYIKGMLIFIYDCDSGAREHYLDAARFLRRAAQKGLMEAQFELGEMFRTGLICDVKMRLARKYIRRAARSGYPPAIDRMKELRNCVFCGADDARRACALCKQARYCDYETCCVTHWHDGGGVGGGIGGAGASQRHKDVCPRSTAT